MQFLFDYALENRALQRLVTEAMSVRGVQGVVLDVDEQWLRWHGAVQRYGRKRAEAEIDFLERYLRYPLPFRPWTLWNDDAVDLTPYRALTFYDLKDMPRYWPYYCQRVGLSTPDPVIVVVRLRSDDPPAQEQLDSLPTEGLRVEFEARTPARLQANRKVAVSPLAGGISIGTGASDGTLGGIVHAGPEYFAVTCSHVVPNDGDVVNQPAARDASVSLRIGQRSWGSALTASTSRCNPYDPTCVMNVADVALIELDKGVQAQCEVMGIGPITGIKPKAKILPREHVRFAGKASGVKPRRVGPVILAYEFPDAGNLYCFEHVLEIQPNLRWGLSSQAGDSGAWVCGAAPGSGGGFEWYGMLIGGDNRASYMVFAEVVETEYKRYNPALVPA